MPSPFIKIYERGTAYPLTPAFGPLLPLKDLFAGLLADGFDKPPLRDPGRVEQPGLVLRTAVAQDRDDGVAGPHLLRERRRRRHIDSRGASEQQTFFPQKAINEVHGLRIRDAQRIIDRGTLEIRGHPAGADAFRDRRAAVGFQFAVLEVVVERAAGWVDENDAHPGGLRFEIAGGARQRAAGAGGGAESVDLAAGVPP